MHIIYIHKLLAAVGMLMLTTYLQAQIPSDCADKQQSNNWPEYYCDCKYMAEAFQLPLDIQISDDRWFKGTISDLSQGIAAYLNSDCSMKFEVYLFCTSKTPEYEKIFEQNKANAIDGTSIKQRLEEAGYGSADGTFYIRISPINGLGGRLILRSQADGMPSSCDDPLFIFPGMSLYSTQTTDVYVLDPSNIPAETDIILQWQGDNNVPCQFTITSMSCDGEIIASKNLTTADPSYTLSAERIDQAWFDDEFLYVHFTHSSNTAGFVHYLLPEYTAVYHDTTICQGMGIQLSDTILTQTTVYPLDTVLQSINQYTINYLRLTVTEPNPQPDTLAFRYAQQPYIYHNQHSITAPGDYDLTIHYPNACDERFTLHVFHQIDTICQSRDTLICYGAIFRHEDKIYQNNISFGQSSWKNQDTLIIDSLHVRFATSPDIIYDTISQNQDKYGKSFPQAGDFKFRYTNPQTYCVDSIILHVQPSEGDGREYIYTYLEYTFCQGKTYNHWGTLYTSSAVIRDTIYEDEDVCEIEITTVTFTEPEQIYETLWLSQSDLPYQYRQQKTIYEFGEYEWLLYNEEGCLEQVFLSVKEKGTTTQLDNSYFYDDSPRIVLLNDVVYIQRGSERFTLLGEKL